MTDDTDDALLATARRLLGETKTRFDRLLHAESGYQLADARLADFERAIRDAARELNDWLYAYDSSGGDAEAFEEIHRRELDRRQPEG